MTDTNRGRIRTEPGHRRVRAYVEGRLVVDTIRPLLVWEGPHYPAYYFPIDDVHARLEPSGASKHSPSRGEGVVHHVVVDGITRADAALRYPESPIPELREVVRLDWNSMDDWFEEDEPVYTHPRDPYHRIDILASSRQVRVEIAGQVVAESRSPRILFETGLPPRYYLPLTDVRTDLLTPSPTRTGCPYKGTAEYYTVRVDGVEHPDLVWLYRTPLPESQKIAGLACFYNEKVDLYIDDVRQDRPKTQFS
ncbi:DUF427 domain-containing protein [Nocardia sp. alder85J]|uniref:DUF427 domain-containing protein n=1 Tax=Nocardia sp. alder85J TaxID=2862949 RepID=UPI001CD30147|nr:DUF427 domain-containing protein [Nocardia sp. alder85J]MCX4093477.1 DUF427 domain-containing protein [Nocardia sp. alder85J]